MPTGCPVLTRAAAVAAGYVPSLREADERRDRAAQAWTAIGEPATDAVPTGPASLLRLDRRVVEFTGREIERAALWSWCTSKEARSLRIVVGPGGVGKTRLALQAAADWEAAGRRWRLLAAGAEANAVTAARAMTADPVLLVADYAETRAELGRMLRAVLDDPGPARVLLLARSLGEWWDRLIEESAPAVGRLLTAAEPVILSEPITQAASDQDLVLAAVPFFAGALGIAVPQWVQFELPAHRVPVLVLHAARFDLLPAVRRVGQATSDCVPVASNTRGPALLLKSPA